MEDRDAPVEEERLPPPTHLEVAEVVAPRGLRGELKAHILTDFPQRFRRSLTVYLGDNKVPYVVERARLQKGWLYLKLQNCDTAEEAEKLRGQKVYVSLADAVPPPEGEYYWFQIIGLQVRTEEGENLGKVVDILQTGSNDVYVVQGHRGEVLIPALEDVIQQVDLEAGLLLVKLPEGLL